MSDDQPAPATIQERIAALKLAQGTQTTPSIPASTLGGSRQVRAGQADGPVTRPKPPPPPRPELPARPGMIGRTATTNNPPTRDHVPAVNGGVGNLPEADPPKVMVSLAEQRPALPPRKSTQSFEGSVLPPRQPAASPALPPRRPSEVPSVHSRRPSDMALSRRGSNESVSSIATARSSLSTMSNRISMTSKSDRHTVRAPEFDSASLPALPPRKTKEEKEAEASTARHPYKSNHSSPKVSRDGQSRSPQPPARSQARPPPLPGRENASEANTSVVPEPASGPELESVPPAAPKRSLPPAKRSALSTGFGITQPPPPSTAANRSDSVPPSNGVHPPIPSSNGDPPPIPTASRPDLTALQASKPRLNGAPTGVSITTAAACLHCRDFSKPDDHAARFPRDSIPSTDIGWLSHQLTSPFPSATDKARAIFTWLHHNIAYDVVAFFGNCVKRGTPQSTFASGLAVCEGYASLFVALAVKAGLEAIVVGGNGKGFGYSALRPGDPVPPYSSGHAWNAVKIDGGEWKLIDPCWGAGVVNGAGQPYSKRFAPEQFTKSNDEFGLSHFPEDSSRQYRKDGRRVSWEEYITGNKSGTAAQMFNGFVAEEGLSEISFAPVANPIVLSQQGPAVRFSFQKVCPHWDPAKCGKGAFYVYVLHLEGLDGTDRNHLPFQQGDGIWWCDVPVRDLGRPGQKATICAVNSFDNKDGRGVTVDEYRRKKGRVGMSFGFVGQWQVA